MLDGFGWYDLSSPPFLFFRDIFVHWELLVEGIMLLLCLFVVPLLLPRPLPILHDCKEMRWYADFFCDLKPCSPGLLMVFKVRAFPK